MLNCWMRLVVGFLMLASICWDVGKAATYGDFTYEVTNNSVVITGYSTQTKSLVFPSQINGFPVIEIKRQSVQINEPWPYMPQVTSVTLPNSIMRIGENAFSWLDLLSEITIPESVNTIHETAFQGCVSLANLQVAAANAVFSSYQGVLYNKNQTCLVYYPEGKKEGIFTIPQGTTTIGPRAFTSNQFLTILNVPATVSDIQSDSYFWYPNLREINVDSNNVQYTSISGVLFNHAVTSLICYPAGKQETSYVVPSTVTRIEEAAFTGCVSLVSIGLPQSLSLIDPYAFSYCSNLTSMVIPGGVTEIPGGAFAGCYKLVSVSIPQGTTSIGSFAFGNCSSLEAINIPTSVTTIGHSAFSGYNKITSITIPANVTSIGDYAFSWCPNLIEINVDSSNLNYTSVNGVLYNKARTTLILYPAAKNAAMFSMPNTVSVVGKYAFSQCANLTSITLSQGVTTIGQGAFQGCVTLSAINIPSSVTDIENYAFFGCSNLLSVNLPQGLSSLGDGLFANCNKLTSISIPESVTSIGTDNFGSCSSLASIDVAVGNPSYLSVDGILYNKAKTSLIFYPRGKAESTYVMPSTVTIMENGALNNSPTLIRVVLSPNLTVLGDSALQGCSGLTSIDLPQGLTSIGMGAFAGCSGLTSISIPSSVTLIGAGAFTNCNQLNSINVDLANMKYASANGILYNKEKTTLIVFPPSHPATSFVMPSTVSTIEGSAFFFCSKLTSITISPAVSSIGSNAFSSCYNLENVIISEGVTSIGFNAFANCGKLTNISIPSSITTIRDSAFAGCENLASIHVDSANPNYASSDGVLFDKLRTTLILYPARQPATSYQVPSTVTFIEDNAFSRCADLSNITIPSGVTSIGTNNFYGCDSLSSIIVNDANTSYASENGVLYDKNKTTLICYPAKKTSTSYVIPPTVTSIANDAISSSNLNSITITAGVLSIGVNNFRGNNLVEINVDSANPNFSSADGILYNKAKSTLILYPPKKLEASYVMPSSIKTVEFPAFAGCENLVNLSISAGLLVIENNIFGGCPNLESVTIPNGITTIGNAFGYNTKLTNIAIPASVISIEDGIFTGWTKLSAINVDNSNPNYKSVDGVLFNKAQTIMLCYPKSKAMSAYVMPSGVTNVARNCFSFCTNLSSVTLSPQLTSIERQAFSNCTNLVSMVIPQGVVSIGDSAFQSCLSLTSITLPEGVTYLGNDLFNNCYRLTNINIPGGTSFIGVNAFAGCQNLAAVNVDSNNQYYSSAGGVLYDKPKTTLILFPPNQSTTSYATPSTLKNIENYAISGCAKLTNITISSSVTSIGANNFTGCSALSSINVDDVNPSYSSIDGVLYDKSRSVLIHYPRARTATSYVMPSSIKSFNSYQFSGCDNLTSITISTGIDAIPLGAFNGCYNLTSVNMPNGVISIGDYAFSNSKLSVITIPASVISIGLDAFAWCYSLTAIHVDDSNSNFSSMNGVLYNKDKTLLIQYPGNHPASSYVMPTSVISFENHAFSGSSNLTEITISPAITNIWEYAFSNCSNLASIYVNENSMNFKSLDGVVYDKTGKSLKIFPRGRNTDTFTIPSGVTDIGKYAFNSCQNLKTVWIPASTLTINQGAFAHNYNLLAAIFYGNPPALTIDNTNYGSPYYYYGDPSFTEPVTVYYMPETVGWGPIYSGRPTAPWVMQTPAITSFTMTQMGWGHSIRFDHRTTPGVAYRVQCSSDLINWTNLVRGRGEGYLKRYESFYEDGPKKFYRTVQENP